MYRCTVQRQRIYAGVLSKFLFICFELFVIMLYSFGMISLFAVVLTLETCLHKGAYNHFQGRQLLLLLICLPSENGSTLKSRNSFPLESDSFLSEQIYRPRWLSWMRRPTGDQEVADSTPAEVGNILSLIMKYFLRSFSSFR